MAHTIHLERMFEEITFHKLGHEIVARAQLKIAQLQTKIAEREARIAELCAEHRLSPADLFALAQENKADDYRRNQQAYTAPIRDISAGVASALARESQQVESEREQVRTLGILARNIAPEAAHELSFSELEYLAF